MTSNIQFKRFSLLFSIDENGGLSQNGTIPWRHTHSFKRFLSMNLQNCTVIMGRCTYTLFKKYDLPLGEKTLVLTSQHLENVQTFKSFGEALREAPANSKLTIIGSLSIYNECMRRYAYLCDEILVLNVPDDYDCDVSLKSGEYNYIRAHSQNSIFIEAWNKLLVNIEHPEKAYLELMERILTHGETRMDRTEIGTKSLFGVHLEFNLRQGFPLLTTKRTWFQGIKEELLFFLTGQTNTKLLEQKGVNIWKANTTLAVLQKQGLPWKEGDMGPSYGFQLRHWGAQYQGYDTDYTGQGIDQIQMLIANIQKDPYSRRHILSNWNVSDIKDTALPPCHCFCQFYVGVNENNIPRYLDCSLYQRSADMFLGVPFNIASYALLLSIIAHITKLIPRRLIMNFGDAHVYNTHITQVQEQIKRAPLPFPIVSFQHPFTSINEIKSEDIVLEHYISHPTITAEMAI